ncbi:MAG: Mov34/MPN/PAD-1 family protein [Anaerolineae bacterium]|nr:Mov34/MPN/PAD-1 family protein [Anaerolineae bacterium]NUQ03910.1 Mov34/MPN/PAD-1 family protein [Anaerolineae bacterium]
MSIEHIQLDVQPVISKVIQNWEVRISESVNSAMHYARWQRFPNETGGVLVGTIDIQHKVVQVADLIPSPPDSVEWPTMYIRGSENLRDQIEQKFILSGGDLRYVGEWHTHPQGHSNEPSRQDLEAHQYLVEQMAADGLPGVVLIKGENHEPYVLLDWKP